MAGGAMKIAVYAPMDLTQCGGVETHILELAAALTRQGAAIRVFGKKTPHRYFCASLEEFEANDFDIVHTHACLMDRRLWSMHRQKRFRHVHTLHGVSLDYMVHCRAYLNWRSYSSTLLEGMLARRADGVICINRQIAQRARQWLGMKENKLKIIYNGFMPNAADKELRNAWRQELGFHDEDIAGLFVGRGYDKVKGTDIIAAAMAASHRRYPQLKLLAIPGDGFQAGAAWLRQTGNVPHERIGQYYQAADFFVNASRHEGLPLTLIEAMGAGLPIIAARAGGIPELIRDDENGRLLDKRRDNLADLLEWIVTQREAAKALGERAKQDSERLTWDIIAAETLRFYEQVCRG